MNWDYGFRNVTRNNRRGIPPSSNSSTLNKSYPCDSRSTFTLSKKFTMKPPTSYISSPRWVPVPKCGSPVDDMGALPGHRGEWPSRIRPTLMPVPCRSPCPRQFANNRASCRRRHSGRRMYPGPGRHQAPGGWFCFPPSTIPAPSVPDHSKRHRTFPVWWRSSFPKLALSVEYVVSHEATCEHSPELRRTDSILNV